MSSKTNDPLRHLRIENVFPICLTFNYFRNIHIHYDIHINYVTQDHCIGCHVNGNKGLPTVGENPLIKISFFFCGIFVVLSDARSGL